MKENAASFFFKGYQTYTQCQWYYKMRKHTVLYVGSVGSVKAYLYGFYDPFKYCLKV